MAGSMSGSWAVLRRCYPLWMDSSYVPLSKSDEKPRAHKIITGGPPAPALGDIIGGHV